MDLTQPLFELAKAPLIYTSVITLGATIGSFLNVVIYRTSAHYKDGVRIPCALSTINPKGSFCPSCRTPLTWKENIPILSYILQAGKCRHCKTSIPIQYPLVEATITLLFLGIAHLNPSLLLFATTSIFATFLLAISCIDRKTFCIPNKLVAIGTTCLLLLQILQNKTGFALTGMLTGYAIGFLCNGIGKLLFGKKKVRFGKPIEFRWESNEETGLFTLQEPDKTLKESEPIPAEELFHRDSDSLRIDGKMEIIKNNEATRTDYVEIKIETIKTKDKDYSHPIKIQGTVSILTFPREAFGMGDAKMLLFLGTVHGFEVWKILFFASISALFVHCIHRIICLAKNQSPPERIAFGPWLAFCSMTLLIYSLTN